MGVEVIDHPLDRTVLVGNGKGGVGKTSLSANLAAEAASDGLDVLLIDLDPQGNLAEDLGYSGGEIDDDGAALARSLLEGAELVPQSTARDRLRVVPGGARLREVERHLAVRAATTADGTVAAGRDNGSAYLALANPLARIAGWYDLIVLDSPPGAATLSQVAMGAARWLVVPARDDDSSRKGLRRIELDFDAARAAGARVELLAVLLFGTPATATAKRAAALARLRADLGDDAPLLRNDIRYSTAATAARYLGLTVSELAAAYRALPPWHQLRKRSAVVDELPLPATGAMSTLDPAEVVRVIRGTGGNLEALAGDYDRLAEEVFDLINHRESAGKTVAHPVKAGS